MGSLSIWHWLIVLLVVVLVFGTKKLRNLGGDVGGAVKSFKDAMNEEKSAAEPADVTASAPQSQETLVVESKAVETPVTKAPAKQRTTTAKKAAAKPAVKKTAATKASTAKAKPAAKKTTASKPKTTAKNTEA